MSATADTVSTTADRKDQLEKHCSALDESIEKYRILYKLCQINSNYKHVSFNDLHIAEAECFLLKGSLQRQIAQVPYVSPLDQEGHLENAKYYINEAHKIFKDPHLVEYCPKECTNGRAKYLQENGFIKLVREQFIPTKRDWEEACALFKLSKDEDALNKLQNRLDKLLFQLDRVSFINSRLKDAANPDNREREAVLCAFRKFDRDGSGEMDQHEFASLALELGTYPPLREEELREAMVQLDQSTDGKVTFDELWAWWSSEEVHQALERQSKASNASRT